VSGAADFVERFASFWRAPAPDRLDALLAEDVLLVAPLTPTTRTLADGKRAFAGLLALAPDLTGEVHRWGATEDGVLIEFTLAGTAAGAAVSWDAIDRISLRDDGLASARISYFDSGPLVRSLARRPRSWLPFLRSRLQR
jgi:ketosteroid isomerase-like protein